MGSSEAVLHTVSSSHSMHKNKGLLNMKETIQSVSFILGKLPGTLVSVRSSILYLSVHLILLCVHICLHACVGICVWYPSRPGEGMDLLQLELQIAVHSLT